LRSRTGWRENEKRWGKKRFYLFICGSRARRRGKQGCQIFLGPKYQNGGKYTKLPQNIPNGHKLFPMAVK
jgi:hypothetical protein